jgi:hypothetical protein
LAATAKDNNVTMVAVLDDIFCQLTPRQVFMLGRLDAAFSNFKFQSAKVKPAKVDMDNSPFGPGLASLGDFYDGMRRDCENAYREAVAHMVEAERFFRKCRHECLEAGAPESVVAGYVKMLQKKSV